MQNQRAPKFFRPSYYIIMSATAFGLVACGPSSQQSATHTNSSAYAASPYNFRLSLTDAPNDELKSVIVRVKSAELRLSGSGKEGRVIVAENLGDVDLLTLQNGVTLPMADLDLPEGVTVTQIRLVLDSEGNHIIKSNGSRCDLKTPSAQQTGIKFLIHQGVTIEKGYSYSIVADFDAKKSVVLQGNSGCLLKPVLKLKSATRVDLPPPVDTGDGGEEPTPVPSPTPGSEEPVPSPTPGSEVVDDGSTQIGDETGFDSGSDEDVPVIPEEDLSIYYKVQ